MKASQGFHQQPLCGKKEGVLARIFQRFWTPEHNSKGELKSLTRHADACRVDDLARSQSLCAQETECDRVGCEILDESGKKV